MAPPTNGGKFKPFKKNKEDARSLKRKRDVDEHEKLEKAVAELVKHHSVA
jgi:ATP-dependent RNA helicase DDX10/DBP4